MAESSILPRHVAIIMDGNGRWAQKRGLPRLKGHYAGGKALLRVVEACFRHKIPYLTLYAFSAENQGRPQEEVEGLFRLFFTFSKKHLKLLLEHQIRLRIIGDWQALPLKLRDHLRDIQEQTQAFFEKNLTVALNYGGRQEILRAITKAFQAQELEEAIRSPESFSKFLDTAEIPDPDLVIRSSGELRLSNFLPWQSTYSELYFSKVLWPDFDEVEFAQALTEYAKRQRRWGK